MRRLEERHLAAGAITLATVLLGACAAAAPAETSTGLETAPVEQRALDVKVEASGTVQPPLIVDVKSKASGEVLKLYAQTGDEVKKGQLLADIDPRDVRNGYAQAQADLEVAKAQLANATEQLKRDEALRKSNVITAQEYEQAVLSEASARSQLVKAQVNLQLAQQKLSDVTIVAPLNATVLTRTVEEGTIIASASQTVSGGTTLFQIANTDTMQVKALVDETDIGRVRAGQPVAVSVDAYPNRSFPGVVEKIEPEATVDQNVTMFPVIINIENGDRLLKTGMNADVEIEVARRPNAIVVPNDAVVSPSEAVSVGSALGLSQDQVEKGLQAPPEGAAKGAPAGGSAAAGPQGELATQCRALFTKLRSGGGFAAIQSLSEADRATLRKCRGLMGGGRGGPGGRGGAAARGKNDTRPGVVFVETADGVQPRNVVLGVNDWDYTEVVHGVKPGEKVIMTSVARVQQQTNELQNRIRQRAGGMLKGNAGHGPRMH